MYSPYTDGTIDSNKKEVSVKFSGYPITSRQIDEVAQDMLTYLITDGINKYKVLYVMPSKRLNTIYLCLV